MPEEREVVEDSEQGGPETQESPEVINFKEEAIGYIEDELSQGYGLEQIKKGLLDEGYPEEIINFAVRYVAKHSKVSKKDKEKDVVKTDEAHMARRFHIPVMSITAVIMVLIVVFLFVNMGEEEKEIPQQIDIFLYDNLGITPNIQKIEGSSQSYARDELPDEARAKIILEQNRGTVLLSKLKVSNAVKGFQKRATLFDVSDSAGVMQKTLVEIRFQADRDVDSLKLAEQVPAITATSGDIDMTQGGVKAGPVLLFTFNNVKAGDTIKAVYVINKEVDQFETFTFTAEDSRPATPSLPKVCGDGKCVEGENYLSCCTDCGCLPGFICESNSCAAAVTDECSLDGECDDSDTSTADVCSGTPKTCQNNPIKDCISGDMYCAEGCNYMTDDDCEPTIEDMIIDEEEVDLSQLNISGDQESPDIHNITIKPENLVIDDEFLIEALVTDANGKEDIRRVWVEIMELAESHGEVADMNDLGINGDARAGDNVYTVQGIISDYYLTGQYHANVFAEDWAGNKKKRQATFVVS